MKIVFLFCLTISILQADEMQRIESIIEDITKLRVEYEECQKTLESKGLRVVKPSKECEKNQENIKALKAKNLSLETSLKEKTQLLKSSLQNIAKHEKTIRMLRDKNAKLEKNNQDKEQITQNNQKEIKNYKNILKTKEKEIISLKNQMALLAKKEECEPKIVIKEIIKEVVEKKKIYPKDDNVFPTLMPKNAKNIKIKKQEKEEIIQTKPTTYRLKNESAVYNKFGGDEIYIWEKDRSFTSNIKTQNYIKITGYFIDRVWQKAKEELWIKKVDVFER